MSTSKKRLKLNRETLRQLTESRLRNVRGGEINDTVLDLSAINECRSEHCQDVTVS